MIRLRKFASVLAILCCPSVGLWAQSTFPTGSIGVSLAGAEFGTESDDFCNERPGTEGTEYIVNSAESLRFFSDQGVRLVRLPFRWERIQPELRKPLDAKHLRDLRLFCRGAGLEKISVVLDVHNYARYRLALNGIATECIVDEERSGRIPVSRDDLADLWRRLALEFRTEKSVVGYGIMNEPHDMGRSDWKVISQTVVDAIRQVDEKKTIVVAGDDWSSAERFRKANGNKAWIRDPQGNVVYEAHCYFDHDGSGKYRTSFTGELRKDRQLVTRGVDRVRPFVEWCKSNKVRGFIGEYGSPNEPGWQDVTQRFLKECKRHDIAVCYWAAGEWWGEYPLSIHPREAGPVAPQLRWMQSHIRKPNQPSLQVYESILKFPSSLPKIPQFVPTPTPTDTPPTDTH